MSASVSWRLFVIAVALLVILAPTVPDEPAHLSGVMVVLGVTAAVAGTFAGLVAAVRGTGSLRKTAMWATVANALVLMAMCAWFVGDALADLSAPAI